MPEGYTHSKTLLVLTGIIIVLVLGWAGYYIQRARTAADKTSRAPVAVVAPTVSPTVSATPSPSVSPASVSSIKESISKTDVDDVKATVTGLKASLNMFNR